MMTHDKNASKTKKHPSAHSEHEEEIFEHKSAAHNTNEDSHTETAHNEQHSSCGCGCGSKAKY